MAQRTVRIAGGGVALGFALSLIAGCAETAPLEALGEDTIRQIGESLVQQGFVEQASFLEDGRVTPREYRDAAEGHFACLASRSIQVVDPTTSKVDGITLEFVVSFEGRLEQDALPDIEYCEARYWTAVSAVYQDTADIRMDEALRVASIECLNSNGYAVDGAAHTPLEMAGEEPIVDGVESEQWKTVQECIILAHRELFPEVDSISIPFR